MTWIVCMWRASSIFAQECYSKWYHVKISIANSIFTRKFIFTFFLSAPLQAVINDISHSFLLFYWYFLVCDLQKTRKNKFSPSTQIFVVRYKLKSPWSDLMHKARQVEKGRKKNSNIAWWKGLTTTTQIGLEVNLEEGRKYFQNFVLLYNLTRTLFQGRVRQGWEMWDRSFLLPPET